MRTAILEQDAAAVVVDLMHDAPRGDPRAAAYLLAALIERIPSDSTCLAVVDPGVGGDRPALIVQCDGRYFVGPGNGLFEILWRRAANRRAWRIDWRPATLSETFHGRDLFAPVAAMLTRRVFPATTEIAWDPGIARWPDDLPEVIYADGFGNVMSGLRASRLEEDALLSAGGQRLRRARKFCDVAVGEAFWYENSIGLAEVAVNQGSAAETLGLKPGDPVTPLP